ncbi:MAG: MmgE/PrpD family protein, partial [Rhizobiales bacterium]|nr:MmgE/PrpD family protein [Hyphomicrobiales bacterium]
KKQGAEVRVTLKDGRTLSRRLADVIPADIPLIRRRFDEAASETIGAARARELAEAVDGLDRSGDVGAIMRLTRTAARA